MLPINVKYLAITWDEHKNVVKIEKSIDSLEVIQDEGRLEVESITYPRVEGNAAILGFNVEEKLLHTPYFLTADGQNKEELLRVVEPNSGEVWWIQHGDWNAKKHFYKNEIVRNAGRYTLVINDCTLNITNHTVNFTVEELEFYLNDFKNSFWQVIIDNSSVSKARVRQSKHCYFNNEIIDLLSIFSEYCEKLIKNPNMYLSETQDKVPLKLVKPLPKTFREYSTHPNVNRLTSRTHIESYDTPENRFIYYCISRIIYIFKNMHKLSKRQEKLYKQHIDTALKWKNSINKNTKIIDEDVINNEITFLKNKQVELESTLLNLSYKKVNVESINYEINQTKNIGYNISLGGKYSNFDNVFFVEKLNEIHKKDFKYKHKVDFILIKLPFNIYEKDHIFNGVTLNFQGEYTWERNVSKNGKLFWTLTFFSFSSLKITKNEKLDILYTEKNKYENNNWIAPLSTEEINFRNSEIKSIDKKINFYTKHINDIHDYTLKIDFLVKSLSKKLVFFDKNKVKKISSPPNSMVFIQNNTYRTIKNTYTKLLSKNGIPDSILNSLETLDEVGIINISNVYERWCLLQIINVLSSVYGFFPIENWQENLVSAILNSKYNIEILFQAPHKGCSLLLTYEKELESKVRPDFVLELFEEGKTSASALLTLDAKFRGNEPDSKLYEILEEIAYKKNYRQDGLSSVFVIHPIAKATSNPTSPLSWGKFCDYGQSAPQNHSQGLIFLSPTRSHQDSMENIQRLLGMFIQKNYVLWADRPGERPSRVMCVSCGNHNFAENCLIPQRTDGGRSSCFIKCPVCFSQTKQNICKSCRQILFKNGFKWTYHRTKASEITNVICPKCGDYF